MEKTDSNKLPKLWFALANMLPPIGVVLYLSYRKQWPLKAQKALRAAIIGIPAAIMLVQLMNSCLTN